MRSISRIFVGALVLVSAVSSLAAADPGPIAYAHYMHCYILGGMAATVANDTPAIRDVTVSPDDWPAHENSERTWWSARLAPEAQGGLSAVQQDFALGDKAGLDAFGLLIGNNHLPRSQFAPGMCLAAQAAQTSRVKIIPDLWGDFEHLDATGEQLYGQHVKAFMDAYPGAFLTRDGKYVISLGCPMGYGRNSSNFTTWDSVKPFFDAWGGPSKFYIILNITNDPGDLATGWGSVPDAYCLWTAPFGWGDEAPLQSLAAQAQQYGKALAWPIHSSYYGGRKGCESMAETLGASTFCDRWREAIARKTPFAAVQTWNDFSEDHAITETNYRGDTLIDLNRYFSDWYHNGRPPTQHTDRVFLFHHRQLTTATLTDASILAHNDKWHKTPTVDYLDVVSILKSPAKLTLSDGSDSWTLNAPKGFHEWLVYVPSTRKDAGPLKEAFDAGDGSAYPHTDAERTVQAVPSIATGTPSVAVSRSGKQEAVLTSQLPLSDKARWQDLSLVGTEVEF